MVSMISNNMAGVKNLKANNQVSTQKQNSQPLRFTGSNDSEYKNPVSRGTERTLAAAGAAVFSGIVGTIAGFVAHNCLQGKKNPKMLGAVIGAGVGLATAAVTVTSAIYNAGVNSFIKKKNMGVFSREKSVETNLSEQIDKNTKNPEVPLRDNIDDYFKYKVGKNGNGVGLFSS